MASMIASTSIAVIITLPRSPCMVFLLMGT
jgi:hypothetical protein